MENKLTLLFGMPRSGTTWLGKIFDSHPDTLYRHEPDNSALREDIPLYANPSEWPSYVAGCREFVVSLPAMNSSRVAASLPVFPKNYIPGLRFLWQRCAILATRATEAFAYDLPLPTLHDGAKPGSLHVVWKSIESIGRLGVIARAIPECRAVLILRHPCAFVASVLNGEAKGQFTESDAHCEDYEIFEWLLAATRQASFAPSLDTLKKLEPVERMAWRWVLANNKALADASGLENCRFIRYEDVCADPFAEAWELFHFAGLSWHPQVAAFIKQSTTRHSNRYYSVFKDPAVAANKWRKELPAETIARVMNIVEVSPLSEIYDRPAATNPGEARIAPARRPSLAFECAVVTWRIYLTVTPR